jgi:hypothetical protein
MKNKLFIINTLLSISAIIVFGLLSYNCYIYMNPHLASQELYQIEKKNQDREKQMNSFAMALDDFDKQTKNSNGKAIMSMLNIPENAPEELPNLEFAIKSKALDEIVMNAIILIVIIGAIIFDIFVTKHVKKNKKVKK